MLIEITEPGEEVKIPNSEDIIVGIDFGTTNSLISIINDGNVVNLGKIASSVRLAGSRNNFEIKSIKRFFGRSYDELKNSAFISDSLKNILHEKDSLPTLKIDDTIYYPVQIAASIFLELKKIGEAKIGKKISKAVVTVPAYFDDNAKTIVKDSAKIAGIDVIRLIAEPTAAAYAYGLENKSEGCYLVYDLGGGTFDVSVLKMSMGVFQVLSISGDSLLGGDDIDFLILKYLANKYNFNYKVEKENDFLNLSRNFKEKLSILDQISQNFEGINFTLTIEELNNLAKDLINKTIKISKKAILDSSVNNIKSVILVGGSTKMRLIKDEIKNQIVSDIIDNFDPEEVVCAGAARQAENLSKNLNDLLIDVIPLSLGIEILGGFSEKIIERNSPIPNSVTKYYTTSVDNQTGLDFHIIQGDREFATDCRSLGKFSLKSIPKMPAGLPRIAVTFSIDPDGLLFITAFEEISNQKQEIVIKPSYGLSDEKILEMLKTAMENAEEDFTTRASLEKTQKAREFLNKFYSYLDKYNEFLEEYELINLKDHCQMIENLIKTTHYELIDDEIDKLQKNASLFIQNIINKELTDFLSGKNINEFKG